MLHPNRKRNGLTTIAISIANYKAMKEMGRTGDTFNDVLTKLLKEKAKPLEVSA
jgi:predicted CopG family antitoxin